MDLQAQAALMKHATEFTNGAVEHLTGRLGRAPNDQELLIFSSAIASMMGSWCYSKIHESAGREHADTWMQQIFVQLGVGVQARGTPVTLQITLKSIPMQEQAQSSIVQDKPPIVICKCVTDAAGQCPSCLKELSEGLANIIDVSATLEKFQAKNRCKPCVQKLFDSAFAKVIEEKYASVSQTIRDMITTMAVQMGAANGVTDIPKIEAALSSFAQK